MPPFRPQAVYAGKLAYLPDTALAQARKCRRRGKRSSAFDNARYRAKGRKSLLENYLTDSIHVKC